MVWPAFWPKPESLVTPVSNIITQLYYSNKLFVHNFGLLLDTHSWLPFDIHCTVLYIETSIVQK